MDKMDYDNPNMRDRQQRYVKSLHLLENPNERVTLNILDTTMISETNPKPQCKLDWVAIRENFDSYSIKIGNSFHINGLMHINEISDVSFVNPLNDGSIQDNIQLNCMTLFILVNSFRN